jgi:hypothetical protein
MHLHASRRTFLKSGMLASAALATGKLGYAQSAPSPARRTKARELATDLVIIGGGLGGCAAALAAARNGMRVIMTEETDWIGGQLTSQAVPPDENALIETVGATRSYQAFRQKVRDYYARNFPLTEQARANKTLNPGNGGVSRLCHEPRVALAVLEEMLAPFVAAKKVQLLLRFKATAASVAGDRVEAVTVRSAESGNELILRASLFVDATEMGDLLPMTRTEYFIGAESQRDTHEPHAPLEANPRNMQSFTCCSRWTISPAKTT